MNRKVRGITKAAASISLAGGVLAMAASPAFAASPNESYAADATGLIHVSPIAEATFPGTSPVNLANVDIGGLLTAHIAHDTADATDASSTLARVSTTLSPLAFLAVDAVTSSCTLNTNTDTLSGTAGLINGFVTTPLGPIRLDAHPAPNTIIDVPGIARITLNRQRTAPDGTLIVNAIYISLLTGTQTLTVGTSVCNSADLAPVGILPGAAMPIGLGTLGLLALGGTGYYFTRRRRTATIAA
jgi:hypothetical protein